MAQSSPSGVRFGGSEPILRVDNMQASVRFYVEKLGFKTVSWGTDDFTKVIRDQANLFLCRGSQGLGGAWVWISVADANQLHEELKARGVAIRMPPTKYPWAVEMQVEDLDGNVLRLGSDAE